MDSSRCPTVMHACIAAPRFMAARRAIAMIAMMLSASSALAIPFTSTGLLGDLGPTVILGGVPVPVTSIDFNTTTGAYSINGTVQPMQGRLSTDLATSTRLYDFSGINIPAGHGRNLW